MALHETNSSRSKALFVLFVPYFLCASPIHEISSSVTMNPPPYQQEGNNSNLNHRGWLQHFKMCTTTQGESISPPCMQCKYCLGTNANDPLKVQAILLPATDSTAWAHLHGCQHFRNSQQRPDTNSRIPRPIPVMVRQASNTAPRPLEVSESPKHEGASDRVVVETSPAVASAHRNPVESRHIQSGRVMSTLPPGWEESVSFSRQLAGPPVVSRSPSDRGDNRVLPISDRDLAKDQNGNAVTALSCTRKRSTASKTDDGNENSKRKLRKTAHRPQSDGTIAQLERRLAILERGYASLEQDSREMTRGCDRQLQWMLVQNQVQRSVCRDLVAITRQLERRLGSTTDRGNVGGVVPVVAPNIPDEMQPLPFAGPNDDSPSIGFFEW